MSIYKRNTFVYYITQLWHSLIFTIPIWIAYYQDRISPSEISLLVTLQYITQMILELPSGALADLIGRRLTNALSFLIGALSYLLFPFANNIWHFAIYAFFVGMSDSLRSGAEEALIYDTLKQEKKTQETEKVYAKANMIYQVGLITSTASGGLIYLFSLKLPFILYGISLLIGSAFAYFYIEPKIDSEKFTLKNYILQIKHGAKEVFKNQYNKLLSLFYITVAGISWASTLYFNAYMMIDLGFKDDIRGYLTAGMRILNVFIISSLLTNKKIFNWQRTVLFFPIIMLIGYLPGVFLNSYFGLPFVQAAMIATTARWIVLSPLTNKVFSSKYRATAISFLSLLIGVIYIALTSVSGLVIPKFGIKFMYTLLGLITLFTVVPISAILLKKYPENHS